MAEIIRPNFGKKPRIEDSKSFKRLRKKLDQYEAMVRADPFKYLHQAGKEIQTIRAEIFSIWELVARANMPTVGFCEPEYLMPLEQEYITVNKKEYEALKEAYKRIAKLADMA